jgi:hypothetical protein
MKIWKDVKDFPNYQVSNLGNVRNKKTNKLLKWMDVLKNEGRYICYEVILYNDTRKVGFHKKIHRLVAEAFIANPDNKCDVDHIDGNTDNNNMTNLRWATRAENRLNTNNKPKYTNPTGEINISMNNDKFVVRVNRKNIGTYATLEEAQDARYQYINKLLNASIKKVSEYGKYITKREERTLPYIFQIQNKNHNVYKSFATKEEAIKARDEYLKPLAHQMIQTHQCYQYCSLQILHKCCYHTS